MKMPDNIMDLLEPYQYDAMGDFQPEYMSGFDGEKYNMAAGIVENRANAKLFCKAVDSAAVYVNASTRFTDGGEFGLGCEMGSSTQKLHARGPMGLKELTTYKYIIKGTGQIR